MTECADGGRNVLIVGLSGRIYALPLTRVIETMRPLPIEPIAGMPPFVRGVSIIRGLPTPVVDLGVVLGTHASVAERLVTVRLEDRQVAFAVDAVVGIRELDASALQELPPLLQGASGDAVAAIGMLDEKMLMILRAGWELPEEVWQALAEQGVAS
jgi:purine-binding chemotaxis protein CheW